ncbi:MAG: hypothetical protein IOD03_16330 [Methylocystis sp.]|nr:hypothetical protein [Methylocystis sp.]
MIGGPFAAGLGDQIGIRHLIRRAQMAINPHQAGEFRVRGQRVAQPDIADGLHAMRGEHDDSVEIPIGAALIIGRGMDEHDGPAHFAAAKDDLVFREWLAEGLRAPCAGGGGIIDRAAGNSGG